MTRTFSICILATAALTAAAAGQVPYGYEVIQITDDATNDRDPRINGCGTVVYRRDLSATSAGIFLYDNGKTTQISGSEGYNFLPDINDAGTVVWAWGDGESPEQVMLLQDGVITQLTDDPADDRSPRINSLGHVAWKRRYLTGCLSGDMDIMFYDGATIVQFTDDEWSNQSVSLNDHDHMAWTRYNWCPTPWQGEIMLLADGPVIQLSDQDRQHQVPSLNNSGRVAWSGLNGLYLWEDGVTTLFLDSGSVVRMNNSGELIFQLQPEGEPRQIWWYHEPEFFELTQTSFDNTTGGINDSGEGVWRMLNPDHRDIGMLRRVRNGDTDLDSDVDAADFAGFPDCMTGPGDFDRLCDCRFYDLDHDRDVDMDDYILFQDRFTGPIGP